jgi:hypothetical protein
MGAIGTTMRMVKHKRTEETEDKTVDFAQQDVEERKEFERKQEQVDADKKNYEFVTVPEKIAHSTIIFKHRYIQELRDRFVTRDRMKRVDEFYPYAKGGPLFVDYAHSEAEFDLLMDKVPLMRALGHRYLIMERDMGYPEALNQIVVNLKGM